VGALHRHNRDTRANRYQDNYFVTRLQRVIEP